MRQHGLTQPRKRRTIRTTDSTHTNSVAPNLLNHATDAKWVADMTDVATDEGWLYLAAWEDVYSRRSVGWAMSERCDAALVTRALRMAVARRVPAEGMGHHSDRGSPSTSNGYQALLGEHGVQLSMSRTGNGFDTALMESFWARLKVECLHEQRFQTHLQARGAICESIEVFFNRQRRHSSLGYLSPLAFKTNRPQSVGSPPPYDRIIITRGKVRGSALSCYLVNHYPSAHLKTSNGCCPVANSLACARSPPIPPTLLRLLDYVNPLIHFRDNLAHGRRAKAGQAGLPFLSLICHWKESF
jgi:transposase InsO family protein